MIAGLLVQETRKAATDDEERELTATESFKSFNYWNLDRSPTEYDKLPQALKWLDIAKIVRYSVYPACIDLYTTWVHMSDFLREKL